MWTRSVRALWLPACAGTLLTAQNVAAQSTEETSTLHPELQWEVGAPIGETWESWSRIADAALLDGRIFVLDVRLREIRAFSENGKYLTSVGRLGQGPGEFGLPRSLDVRGDTLMVLDWGLDRVVAFDSSGRHLRTYRHGWEGGRSTRLWALRDGWTAGLVDYDVMMAWDPTGQPDTLGVFPIHAVEFRIDPNEYFLNSSGLVGGPDGGGWVLDEATLIVVTGEPSRLTVYSVGAEGLHRELRTILPGARETVPASDHAELWSRVKAEWDNSPRVVDPQYPNTWPIWTSVMADQQGRVWLRRGGRAAALNPEHPEVWVAWKGAGEPLSTLRLPAGSRAVRFVGSDGLIAKRLGTADVEVLQYFVLR